MKRGNKNVEVVIYPGAGHGFFADYRPSFNQAAAADAWKRCTGFFDKWLSLARIKRQRHPTLISTLSLSGGEGVAPVPSPPRGGEGQSEGEATTQRRPPAS